MANNVSALDSAGTAKIVKTTETASVHVPHVNIDNVSEITAGQDNLLAAIGEVQASPTANTVLDRLKAINTALVTTLGGFLNDVETLLTAIRDNADGLEAAIATLNGNDFATEVTSAAILAKIIPAPATEAKQDDAITELASLVAKDFATQTTSAAILAKLIATPATEAKQDALIAKDFATQTTLAALLAKVIASPATEAKQDTLIGHVDGVEAELTALNAAVATAVNQIGASYTDRGTTITTGGTAQELAAANAARRYLFVQNDSDEDMRINPTGTASATAGAVLPPSAVWEPVPPPLGAISIFSATTGKRFQAWEG